MRLNLIRTFFFGIAFVALPIQASAASLYIDPSRAELNRGDAVELSVRLDVDEAANECINAVDGVLTYTENVVPVDVSLGDSIFSIWVEEPTINTEERTISFAGGMPNGYCGRIEGDPRLTNTLVTLIFRSPGFTIGGGSDDPTGVIEFAEFTTAYVNDGLGTKVAPRTFGSTLTLNKNAGSGIVDPWREAVGADVIPPEEFSIFLEKDEKAFSGKYYISFNTTDKQTGIDEYQVIEEPISDFGSFNWGRADAPWVPVRSPYVLEDQTLNSVIRVKAIDKAGNEYIATLLPDDDIRGVSEQRMAAIAMFSVIGLIVLGCLGVVFGYIYERLRRRKNSQSEDQTDKSVNDEEEEDYEDDGNTDEK